MTDWIAEAARLRKTNEPAVLVTVAGVRGSAPREVGAKMLVTAQDSFGTIGGGALEYQSIRIAAERLRAPGASACLRRFPLGSNCGQCCGGVVDILFEPLQGIRCIDALLGAWQNRQQVVLLTMLNEAGEPIKHLLDANGKWQRAIDDAQGAAQVGSAHCDEPGADAVSAALSLLREGAGAQRIDTPGRGEQFLLIEPITESGFDIAVFGAGHVGSALIQLLAGLDCALRWIDSRRGIFPAEVPANVQCIESAEPVRDVAALPAASCYFIMTHSHALDLEITAAILRRGDFAYCGLIGSATKRKRFEARLRQSGIDEHRLQRLTCPIGIRGISGKKPQEIAIAAAADVLRQRERQLAALTAADRKLYTLHA